MQTYFAKSIFNSSTLWANLAFVLVTVAEETAFTNIIPANFMPYWIATIAVVNVLLRLQSKRPVAMIMPGETKKVAVESLPEPKPEKP